MKKLSGNVSNMDVRKINLEKTLRCVLACQHISQPELAQKLNISWPTVLQNIKKLVELGLVEEVGAYESTGGRKPRAFAPVRGAHVAIGVEITKNHIGFVLVDLAGELVRYTRKSRAFTSEEGYFKAIGKEITSFLAQSGISEEKILGVGLALPGIVDETGKILVYSHALGIRDMPTQRFSQYIPFPCVFINDANAAGLAELRLRPAGENAVYLSLSNSVGGAILLGGGLYQGNHLRGGEFGHNTLVPDGKECYCGKKGCLDAYCSAQVLSNSVEGGLAMFFHQLVNEDMAAKDLWDSYLDSLAVAINNLRMTFDCDVIVGGYVGGFLEEHWSGLQQRLAQRNTFEVDASYVKPCSYKLEAAAVGGALVQIEAFIEGL